MSEETVTIKVSDFMNFPPTFGTTFEEIYYSSAKKNCLYDLIDKIKNFKQGFKMPKYMFLKETLNRINSLCKPAEVFVLSANPHNKHVCDIAKNLFMK